MKLGNPKAQDTPQINLVVDGGIKGTSVKNVSPDTNRNDPVAGAAVGSLSLLMFPRSLKNLGFECFVIISTGLLVQSLLVAIAHPLVWVITGLLLLIALLYLLTSILNHPQCTLSGLSKLILFTVGVFLCAIVVF